MDGCLVDINSLFLAAGFWSNPSNWWAVAQVVLGLGAVIFVHELGHFLVAKACGVKCDKFYVGFDAFDIKIGDRVIVPASLVKYQWGETEYGIGILPLGGYVKMLGQDDNPGNIEKEIERSINEGESADEAYTATGLVDKSKIDPRSFLAKSVPQRMAIISAGVIFNLIFAVLFAAWAFKSGVDYEPPMVGNVVGGGPAWKHDLVGATIERVGEREIGEGYFTFMDLAQEIVFGSGEKGLEIKFKPYGESDSKVALVHPQAGFRRMAKDLPLIGVSPRWGTTIGSTGTLEGETASKAIPAIEPFDVVVQLNETPIKTDIDLRSTLARDSDKVVEFVLQRQTGKGENAKTEIVKTNVDPNPMRRVGLGVEWLPITAIKIGSPAEQVGLEPGDEITAIDDQPRGDLMTLDKRMIAVAREGGTVELEFTRDGESKTVSIEPTLPKIVPELGPNFAMAIDSLGVAIATTTVVETVEPDSPAAEAGVQLGDEIQAVTFLLSEAQKKNEVYAGLKKRPRTNLLDKGDETSWAEISKSLQFLEPGSEIELEIERGNSPVKVKMKTVASNEFFLDTRGISMSTLKAHYQSATWSDALTNGYRQVINDVKRVGLTLVKLIRGKISPKNLGGPGTIALAATSEASQGTSRLLLFLTFLSANLAILNFLPIPILDGGHMLFLAYEGIFRRPVSEKVQVVLTYAGLAMLLCLMLFVGFLDISRISSLF